MNMTFQSLKEDIETKKIEFEETEFMTKEDVNQKFYKWRINNRDKVKLAVLDIENRFRDELTHDYFRNKLKKVVSSEDVKQNIIRSKRRRLTTTTQSQIVIEDADIAGSTVDTGKGWFCCMPKR